jgi:hypothetical protein
MIDFLSARVRTRRAIFCFRIRPNRDLSPLRRDMVNTCFQNKCKVTWGRVANWLLHRFILNGVL